MYTVFYYKADSEIKTDLSIAQIDTALKDNNCLIWVDISEADDPDVELLTDVFKFHPLTVEDCLLPNARPKLEKFNNYLFMVTHAIELSPTEKEEVRAIEVDFCLGKNFLVTFHSDDIKTTSMIKDRVKKGSGIITQGPDFLLSSILEAMVDNYFPIINMLDNKVDDMSDALFREPSPEALGKMYHLKNKILYLRRTLGPQADMLNLTLKGDFEFIAPANIAYFRNVYDNLVRLNDIIGTSRDTITSAMEVYVSIISNKLNEIMKTLTIIATIAMPLTLIASIYGMNFQHMPELTHRFGYPAVLGLMFLITIVMLIYFKRKRWL